MSASVEEPAGSSSVYELYKGLIATGQLGAGERLPTVRQTALDLKVSPGTAARAFKQLESEGLVITRTAAGTRVAPNASPLPAAVVAQIRALITTATLHELAEDDILPAMHTMWDRPQ
jgi:DNA-binding transcriptional regulator YhcF (GntR family)